MTRFKLYQPGRLMDGGGLILFLIIASIFGKAVYSVDKATDGGENPIVWEEVYQEATGGIEPPLMNAEWYAQNINN